MLQSLMKMFFGSKNERFIADCKATVERINALEQDLKQLSDCELQSKTLLFKQRLTNGEDLNALLPECFAVVREASVRTIGLRHHDVQLYGGIALHRGNIAEMATGEGKTLVATLPVYLNALSGKGVHVVTVNSYLARRDAEWMGKIYSFLGLTVGVIGPDMETTARKQAYACDITYANNNELGFDYLRDNMVTDQDQAVQRPAHYAIVDEVDSILIDEARTPLIISGPAGQSSELYNSIYPLVDTLQGSEKEDDLNADVHIAIKERQAQLTEKGHDTIESLLKNAGIIPNQDNLYSAQHALLLHYVEACVHSRFLLKKDIHYLVKENEVVIIDEHTGRTLKGRRWSRGHHQATEAKEGVPIQQENQTLASITFQNYFKLYQKISGMTGTADTEAEELEQIYNLEVIVIPTHKACKRVDHNDIIYMTRADKYNAIVKEIITRNAQKQPVLVGTTSIEDSEYLSELLSAKNITHRVLNAKHHAKEADIIAEAGEPGKVTIATNMAGRGTDIILGGKWDRSLTESMKQNPDTVATAQRAWKERHNTVVAAGGLHVLGSERHECRRVDNQLRGRCARQGDPGSSQFFLSLDDHLFRIFPQSVLNFIRNSSTEPGEHLQANMLNHAISTNQKKMESHYFDIRKQLLKYDDIANEQRQILYQQRCELLNQASIHDKLRKLFLKTFDALLHPLLSIPNTAQPRIEHDKLHLLLTKSFGFSPNQDEIERYSNPKEGIALFYLTHYHQQFSSVDSEQRDAFEKSLYLQIVDHHWKEHLLLMEDLREGIGLRGYAQKNPEQEFKIEAHKMFDSMFVKAQSEFVQHIARIQLQAQDPKNAPTPPNKTLESPEALQPIASITPSDASTHEGVSMLTPIDME